MGYDTVIMDTSGSRPNLNNSINGTAAENVVPEDLKTQGTENGLDPIIEMATYADTDVFECYIRGFESRIVMRRKHDDWVNITQVFKIAKFSKTQRTKVLEKESSDMENEKVQGGYGRFQGTWIPLDKAKYMVNKYNIKDPVVSKILEFELDPNNPPMKRSKNSVLKKSSPNGRITSPSSYNKTPKKKAHMNSSTLSRKTKKNSIHLQPNPSPLQNIIFQTPQQAHAINGNNATTISAMSNNNDSSNEKELNMSQINTNETPLTMNYSATQKPLQFYPVPTNLNHPQKLAREKPHVVSFISDGPNQGIFAASQGESMRHIGKKRKKDSIPLEFLDPSINGKHDHRETFINNNDPSGIVSKGRKGGVGLSKKRKSVDKTHYKMKKQQQMMWQNFTANTSQNSSSYQNYAHRTNHSNASSLEMFSTQEDPTPLSSRSASPSEYSGIPTAPATAINNDCNIGSTIDHDDTNALSLEEYKQLILQVLSSEDGSNKDYTLPPQMYHPPADLDINFEIDDQGHTPLHWATAMANVPLLKLLIALNANALQCNSRGFNCITKSTFYNNCYKAGSFAEIASILRICLITPDSNGRLPLHYLVELSVNKSKDPVVINSYMDTVIHNLGQEDYTLLRMCLNFQDNAGNTVLHLAALNLNLELCNKLCYLGSSMDVTNYDNETPASILAKFNLVPPTTINSFMSPQFTKNQRSMTSTILEAPVATTPNISVPHAQTTHDNIYIDKENKPTTEMVKNSNGESIDKNIDVDKVIPENPAEDDMGSIQKDQSNLKLTPYFSSKKFTSRNFLTGADSTTFTTLMDDLSNIDSFVTSSVLKDVKSTPSKPLESSPILYRKRNVLGGNNETDTRKAVSSNEETGLKKPIELSPTLDSPLTAIVASPVTNIHTGKASSGVISLANRLREISNSLVISVNSEISSLKTEIGATELNLNEINQNLQNIEKSERDIIGQFEGGVGVESVEDIRKRIQELQHAVDAGKSSFISCIEKSQALNLATLVQEEESNVNTGNINSPSPVSPSKNQLMNSLKFATELAILQFKRRSKLKRISNERGNINLSSKVGKYRRLIGMTVENIDSKLDEIEMDLRANA